MSTVGVTIDGILWDKATKSGRAVRLEGQGFLTDLEVGGGPIPPQEPVDPGYSPPWARPIPPHPDIDPPQPQPPLPPESELPDPVPPSSVLKDPPAGGGWGLYSTASSAIYWAYAPAARPAPKG